MKSDYTLTTSSLSYPSKSYLDFLKSNRLIKKYYKNNYSSFSQENIKKKILGVNIFYNDLFYIQISQVPKMELPDLISFFGGTLGLINIFF